MSKLKLFLYLQVIIFSFMPVFSADNISEMNLIEQESKYEKEKSEYLQVYVLDKILGPGKAVVIVDVELGMETKTTKQEAKERKSEKKKNLGVIDYLLPGVPNPKSVTQESTPGESKEESGQAAEYKVESRIVMRKQTVTVLYDENVKKDKLDAAKSAIVVSLKLDLKRDIIEFKKTKFTRGFWEELMHPKVLIPVTLAMLLLIFLFGPLSSFLRHYVSNMKEKGGTEITMDSKFDGGTEGGEGGAGASGTMLAQNEAEKKKYQPFEYVNDENLKRLIYLTRKEPPKTIALIVSYLKPEYVKEILNALTPEIQVKVAVEMATIRSMTQEQVMELDESIKEKIEFLIGGLFHLLEVLDQADKITQDNILEYLHDQNPELYDKVRAFIITFEDIANFPDQAMQIIIRELKTQDMARALREAPSEVKDKFFTNMSANAVVILKEEMEYGRPISIEEINEERKKLIQLIKQMEKDGKIFVREKPKSDMLEGFEDDSTSTEEKAADSTEFEKYFAAGIQAYEGGQYEGALEYFGYCAQINPYQHGLYQYLGNTYYALGMTSEAVEAFEQALSMNPDDEQLRNWLHEQKNVIG